MMQEPVIEYLRWPELKHHDLDAWHEMMAQQPHLQRAFLSPEYMQAVDAQTNSVRVVLTRDAQGKPTLFLPLSQMPGVAGALGLHTVPGFEMTDYFGVIALPGTRIDPAALLNATKGKVSGVLYHHLDDSQDIYGFTPDEYRTGLRTDVRSLEGGFWHDLKLQNKKLTSDTERRERKLIKDIGPLQFEWQSSQPEQALAWLIQKKNEQYTRTGKIAAPLEIAQNTGLLAHLLMTPRTGQTSATLSTLTAGDTRVAAHLGLQFGNMLHVWFPVYEASLSAYAPGRILFRYMFEHGVTHGVQVFDRGEGDTPSKRDFANQEHRFGRGLWLSPGIRGWIAHNYLRFHWRLAKSQGN